MCDQIRAAAAAKLDVKSELGVNEIMRSDRTNEAAAMDRANEASPAKSKSVDLIVNGVRREVATGKAADDTVNEKASARVVKEEESDRAVSLVNHVKGENRASLAKASLTAALAMRVAHQDQDGKSAIDAAEVEAEMPATMDESEFVSLQTSRTAT